MAHTGIRTLSSFIILLGFLIAPSSLFAQEDKYVMVVDSELRLMLYKKGLIFNSWKPYEANGFALSSNDQEDMPFEEFTKQFYVSENPAYTVQFYGNSSQREGKCRMYSRSTREGKRLQFYVLRGTQKKYLVFDHRDDYLEFNCYKE